MSSSTDPVYVEQAILLNVMYGDLESARQKIADFYHGELVDFEEHVKTLLDLIQARRMSYA